jgi:hypothetical protein
VFRRAALAASFLICVIPNIANAEIGKAAEIGQIIIAKSTVVKFLQALIRKASFEGENTFARDQIIIGDDLLRALLGIHGCLVRGEACSGVDYLQTIWQPGNFEAFVAVVDMSLEASPPFQSSTE